MTAIYKFLLQRIVSWFSSLTAADFARILEWARNLDKYPPPGTDVKRDALRDRIQKAWPSLKPWMVNLLVELAVMWLRKTE